MAISSFLERFQSQKYFFNLTPSASEFSKELNKVAVKNHNPELCTQDIAALPSLEGLSLELVPAQAIQSRSMVDIRSLPLRPYSKSHLSPYPFIPS